MKTKDEKVLIQMVIDRLKNGWSADKINEFIEHFKKLKGGLS